MKKTKKILITGSLAFDYIMDFPQTFEENILPQKLKTLSVSFLVKNFSQNFGGVSGNIAYNLGLLKETPMILASWGTKDSKLYAIHLKKAGVDTKLISKVKNEFTANMFVMTDKNNCQIAGFYPGAMNKDTQLKIPKEKDIDFIVISPTVPDAMSGFVQEAKKLNISYLYDPAQQIPRLSKKQLIKGISGASILIGNDYEIALISKKTGISKKEMLKKAKIIITTLGEKGSLIEAEKEKHTIGIVKTNRIIDPTGAGDAYIAGFLKGFINNFPLDVCGKIGATTAVFAIEHYGTQRHKFSIKQFSNRYHKAFGEKIKI